MSDLIERVGGINKANVIVNNAPDWAYFWCVIRGIYIGRLSFERGDIDLFRLRQSIADHDRTDHVTSISNHLSPSTKVIDR